MDRGNILIRIKLTDQVGSARIRQDAERMIAEQFRQAHFVVELGHQSGLAELIDLRGRNLKNARLLDHVEDVIVLE